MFLKFISSPFLDVHQRVVLRQRWLRQNVRKDTSSLHTQGGTPDSHLVLSHLKRTIHQVAPGQRRQG